MTKPGPVVLVLSQLDDRYFRGLQGQYRFKLSFRLHLVGEDDYVVRSQTNYRMNRSVNVELDLEAGDYYVLVKIDATRNRSVMPVEAVLRANAKNRREKLMRIGLAYDLAHRKCKVVETEEDRRAREAHEKRQTAEAIAKEKVRLVKVREKNHYFRVKEMARRKRRMEKVRAKQEKRRLEHEKKMAEQEKKMAQQQRRPQPPHQDGPGPFRGNNNRGGNGLSTEEEQRRARDKEEMARRGKPHMLPRRKPLPEDHEANNAPLWKKPSLPGRKMTDTTIRGKPNPPVGDTFGEKQQPEQEAPVSDIPPELTQDQQPGVEGGQQPEPEIPGDVPPLEELDEHEWSNSESVEGPGPEDQEYFEDGEGEDEWAGSQGDYCDDGFREDRMPPPEFQGPQFQSPEFQPPGFQRQGMPQRGFGPRGGGPMRGNGPPGPPSDSGLSSVSELSELSDREVGYYLEDKKKHKKSRQQQQQGQPPSSDAPSDSDEEVDDDPWNAVVAVGFRVYHKVSEEDKDEEIVRLRVAHPNRYGGAGAEDDEGKEKAEKDADTAQVLDLDDSAKDATLEDPEKINIAGGEDVLRGLRASESFRTASSY